MNNRAKVENPSDEFISIVDDLQRSSCPFCSHRKGIVKRGVIYCTRCKKAIGTPLITPKVIEGKIEYMEVKEDAK